MHFSSSFVRVALVFFICCCQAKPTSSTLNELLLSACQSNDVNKVDEILSIKPKWIDKKLGPGKQTPIMAATLSGSTDVVKFLISKNPNVSIVEKDGYTPIHGAAFQGRAVIAQLLIDYGMNPLDKHKDGFTAFHRASWGNEKRHTDTVRVFLENGVPFNVKSDDEKTAMEMTKNSLTLALLTEWKKKITIGSRTKIDDL